MTKLLLMIAVVISSVTTAQSGGVDSTTPASPSRIIDPIRVMFPRDSNSVTIRCLVDPAGKVERIVDMQVNILLRPAFERAVKEWRFKPACRNNIPVRSIVEVKFDYVVQPQGYNFSAGSKDISH